MGNLYRRLLHWAFDRLYHEIAWSYDLVAALVSRGHWRHWITTVLPYLNGGAVLELGCGTGYLQRALAEAGVRHVGYDLSPQMLRHARHRVRGAGFAPCLVRGRGEALSFPDHRFSDVVATFPAPYILDDLTLHEIRRVLVAGGHLWIVDGGQLDNRLYEAAMDAAYRATRQREAGDRYRCRLEQAGFAVDGRRIVVGPSSVALIRARRR